MNIHFTKKGLDSCAMLRFLSIIGGIFIVILCGGCKYYTEGGVYSYSQIKDMSVGGAWHDFAFYVIPKLCAYYELHPDCFKQTGHDEEITVEGFASFIAKDGHIQVGPDHSEWGSFHIKGSKIIDPRGQPIHFVEDLNHDGYIDAFGQHFKVGRLVQIGKPQFSNEEHRFGICEDSRGVKKGSTPIFYCYELAEYKYR